jgi:uncharacterized sulfatase
MPQFLPDVPEVREDVADYLGESQAVDAYVGVLVKKLQELGEMDHTLIVISGDHGMPGVPSGKCNLYDHGVSVAMVIRMPGGKGGRVVDDIVRLPDLAPTFMEVGGVKPPENLYGKTLMPLLKSDKSGQIDPERTWAITGRERHVATAREGNLPYPMRSLHTKDFVYIKNFAPDRWPLGVPGAVTETSEPSQQELENNTHVAYADMDASPTKAWMVQHRNDSQWKWLYEFAFGKRPAEELYDLRKDPDMIINVASEAAYAKTKIELADQLMSKLKEANDMITLLQSSKDALVNEVNELKLKYDESVNSIKVLEEQIGAMNNDSKTLNASNDEKIKALTSKNSEMNTINNNLKTELESSKVLLTKALAQCDQLDAQLATASAELEVYNYTNFFIVHNIIL